MAIELKCFPTELFKDPIKHLKGICDLVNPFPLPTSDTEIDILEDTKKTLAIADANKPAITTIKLAELLHTKKFETIIIQEKNLDLSIKPISKILASAYLGKSLTFLIKDEVTFNLNFNKAIELEPDFYQTYAQVGTVLLISEKIINIEKSIEYFKKCFEIKPNSKEDIIFGNYALSLAKLAMYKNNKDLFYQALEQYEKALNIQPNDYQYLSNYAIALTHLGNLEQKQDLFKLAIQQHEKAISLEPENINLLENYALTLSHFAKSSNDKELFNKAYYYLQKVLNEKPNSTYNLACYYSLTDQVELVKANILHAEEHNTLPSTPYKHLNSDKDLDHVRNEPWFIELLNRLEAKDEKENFDKVS